MILCFERPEELKLLIVLNNICLGGKVSVDILKELGILGCKFVGRYHTLLFMHHALWFKGSDDLKACLHYQRRADHLIYIW